MTTINQRLTTYTEKKSTHMFISTQTQNGITHRLSRFFSTFQEKKFDVVFVYIAAACFVAVMFTLMVLKHNAFNTRIHDFARFSQAIWNTLDGRFLYTSLSERSILGDHFSPIMAAFAPLLWLWPNERVLFLVQAVNVAATGLIIFHLARAKHPTIAVFIALAFFLNPAVHELTLFELRRIIFGMPWLALGLYGLVQKNKPLMLFGLVIALLAKESIAIYVAMLGVYLIFRERDWKWGVGLIVLGAGWAYLIGAVVIPAFNPATEAYPQLYYYDHLGDSYSDLIRLGFTDPMRLIRPLTEPARFQTLFKLFLPLGFLALLEFPLVLTIVPYLGLMFLSRDVDMYQLDKWYTTTITPILFVALISGWHLIPKKVEKVAIGWVVVATLIAFSLYSYAPLGGRFDSTIYQPTERNRISAQMTHRVPNNAAVESHPAYIPHITHVNELYHYNFAGDTEIDFILLDNQIQFQPFGPFEIRDEVANLVANPDYVIQEEVDGIYLMGLKTRQLLAYEINKSAENGIFLDRMEIAEQDEDGFYQNITAQNPTVGVGETIRVTLYWEALADGTADRSVSTRVSASDGFLLTQQDQMPADNYRPMRAWQEGDQIRDVYYLTVPMGTAPQIGSIDIVLYDSLTFENIKFDGEAEVMSLLPIEILSK